MPVRKNQVQDRISTKLGKRHGSVRIRGGSSLAASQFVAAAFSQIANLTTSNTITRRRRRRDLQSHFAEIISGLVKLASEKRNRVAATWATEQLAVITLGCADRLRKIATRDRSDRTQRKSAEVALALVYARLAKYDPLLTNRGSAYRKKKSALMKQRKDVVAATGLIAKTVREELKTAGKYRADLLVLQKLYGNDWRPWAGRQSVPKQYWVTLKLKPFSVKTAREWFKIIIWPQIKGRSRELLPKLQARSKRMQRVDAADPKSGVKPRRLYVKDYYGEFRNSLLSLARSDAAVTSRTKLQR
jgi:hypothetical protein